MWNKLSHAGLALLVLSSMTATGCARLRAKSPPDNPPLEMPPPPPRDIETTETEPPQPVPLPTEPAHSTPPRPRPAPPREQTRPEPAKPETKPEAAPAEPPKTAPTEEAPRPPTLQTVPAAEEMELERGIRATISRANSDLSRVDYRTLNADARTQYDYAKRFIQQAEENIRTKHLEYAKTVADKAAAIAAQLTGR